MRADGGRQKMKIYLAFEVDGPLYLQRLIQIMRFFYVIIAMGFMWDVITHQFYIFNGGMDMRE